MNIKVLVSVCKCVCVCECVCVCVCVCVRERERERERERVYVRKGREFCSIVPHINISLFYILRLPLSSPEGYAREGKNEI